MRILIFLSLCSVFACQQNEPPTVDLTTGFELLSPDKSISATFLLSPEGKLSYTLQGNDSLASEQRVFIEPSNLGFSVSEVGEITSGLSVANVTSREGLEAYDLPWGEVAAVEAPFNEVKITLNHDATKVTFAVTARLFDDGLGLRYTYLAVPGKDSLQLLEELTEFRVAGDPLVNWGPGDWNSYENPVELTKLSKINAKKYDDRAQLISRVIPNNAVMTPATMRLDDGTHLSIHEAALIDFPEMTLEVMKGAEYSSPAFRSTLAGTARRKAKAVRKLPFSGPWRTISVEKRAIDFLDNMLVLNLNEPNKLGDIDWFEPMTYAGVWWEMHLGVGTWDYAGGQSTNTMMEVGQTGKESRHAARTENVKRYIDFCAENKIGGLLVEGWNTGWEVWLDPKEREDVFDFVTPYPDYDLEEIVRYGKEKGVQLIMHHETSASVEQYEKQQDTAFALMQRLGIHAVKTGYVGNILPEGEYHHGQYMSRHFRNTFEKAAEYQIAVNPHEPIKQTGERRTLPNAISAEAAKGMEYNSNGNLDGVNPPSHLPSMVYTRCLAGPFDYTPGIFRLDLEEYRGPNKGIGSTLAKQLAAYVVVFAPVQMVADLPEHYKENGEYHPAMEYIRKMATNWDDTYPLAGELGDYAVVARKARGEERYFIGGIAGDEDREVTVSLDFLPSGKTYELTLYSDAEDAHYQTNRTAFALKNTFVKSTDSLTVNMKKAGGFAGVIQFGMEQE